MELRLRFLGPVDFLRDGQPVDFRPAKAIALLAYLAATDQPQAREHLADLLWPESLPDAARKNLRNTLWAMRKALGEQVLVEPHPERLALSSAVWVDLRALAAAVAKLQTGDTRPGVGELQAAAELYRGPLLDGFFFPDAADLELWLATARERFEQDYLRMLQGLISAHRADGDWPAVAAVAEQILDTDNLREPAHRALIEARARLGDRAQALRQYDRLQATLAHHLGVEPLPETEALRDAILAEDLPPAGTGPPARQPRPRRPAGEESGPELPFVGREAERGILDEMLAQASLGRVQVVLISGEVGIGKSRLWQVWSARLPPGAVVLATRCLDMARLLPYAPLTGLFGQEICLERLAPSPDGIPSVWLAELARLIPQIRQRWPGIPRPSSVSPDEERRRLFEAFTQVLRALRGQPLVFFVDDLHWADSATLDWLVYLVDRLAAEPLLLVGAYRPTEAPPQLERMAAAWRRAGLARPLPLARLTLAESTALLAALDVDASRGALLQAQTAGNPYFLLELSRAAPGDLPPGLVELVQTRLAGLPATAQQVLQAAAVLEADFELTTLRRTSGRGVEETLDALDALLDAAVLVETAGRYNFAHPLVASVARQGLSIARRSFLHRRAAEALVASHGRSLPAIAGRLANHFAQAGRPAQAAHYAEMAGEHALGLAAPNEAVASYRQAMDLAPTASRQVGLGRALYLQGDLVAAREMLCEAIEELEAAGDGAGVARACLALAESYLPSGQGDEAVRWARRALDRIEGEGQTEIVANAHYLLGAGKLQAGGSLAEAEADLNRAAGLAMGNDLAEIATRSRFELGNLLVQRGDLAGAIRAFEATIALAQAADLRLMEILGHNNLAYHTHLTGDLETARTHVEAGMKLAEQSSLRLPYQYLYSTRGEIVLAEGRPARAREWLAQALVVAEAHGNRAQLATVRANLGLVARAQGKPAEAKEQLAEALAEAQAGADRYLQAKIGLWLAELYIAQGDGTAAAEALGQAEALLAGGERQGLEAWASHLRQALTS